MFKLFWNNNNYNLGHFPDCLNDQTVQTEIRVRAGIRTRFRLIHTNDREEGYVLRGARAR